MMNIIMETLVIHHITLIAFLQLTYTVLLYSNKFKPHASDATGYTQDVPHRANGTG